MKTLSNTTQPNYIRTIGDVALTCLIVGLGIFVYSQWETIFFWVLRKATISAS
jgi:hypothetical protein